MSLLNSGVYQIKNEITGKVYIGSSKRINRRFVEHRHKLRNNKHNNQHLQRAWNKYGEENFSFSVLEICEETTLIESEQKYIQKYDSIKKGYNLKEAGPLGKHTEETKRKMSESQKGMKRRLGARLSEDTKRKISETLTGRKRPKEVKEKISESLKGNTFAKGRKLTAEQKREIAEKTKASMTDEVRNKIAKAGKGRQHSEETKRKMAESRKAYHARKRLEKQQDDETKING